ncbi:YkgJ family cysteine cluster protein [Desulfogranum mediterraneum]|uniref:YkgJ family cysteine cluster protein n=1 Tax=Desulfogranum mediterraneum TaxID=160661 RepID=UPI000418A965|nr:YkgJ family cysteine cluster protein [Desulfogranum mediterraneum]
MEDTTTHNQEIFQCSRCGFCCHGETTVSLSPFDQQRMAAELGLSIEEARAQYWRVTGQVVQMKVVDGHCIFYDEAIKGCSVHLGRPERCREWPLHPSILADESNYQTITASCPGLNRELGYAAFCARLKEILDRD